MSQLLHTTFVPTTSPSLRRPLTRTAHNPTWALQIHSKIREIFMPALSSTMTEGKIVSWIKSEGEKLSKGDSVVVVESDKADMDVESFYDGYLAAIMVEEGHSVPIGSPIALLAESEDEIAAALAQKTSSSSAITTPNPAPAPAPDSITSDDTPSAITSANVSSRSSVANGAMGSSVHPASEGGKRVVASPYAKKLAKEYGVDLIGLVGSGPNGRIVAKDVEEAAAAKASAGGASEAAKSSTVGAALELGSVVPFTTMQSAVSRNMLESLAVPTFRVGYTITTDALDALYKKIKSKGVTMTAILAKATALALVKHPIVNSSCRDGKSFTYNSSINIAVAVAIDGGLITPVLQDADKIDIYSLSRKWKELVDKARAKQLQPHEYNTGTFTLSNLGMFGVDRFDAILPPGTVSVQT
ncbi:dihydrolipoyllysine-residue acetyltransferase component 5 of pyruvate dehydrogenase complex [Olea europaea subsp. europaea]|uniref:Dihydrolipoamide acetyltransferase component of pyruvate dehydrogenase complex n=1 Tax=Olea europaea subsp. europaea TaxID=158383 RepID=A0A8S0UTY4_OLEEU|nr:dihydrolipoyllysine-residue acetyltransferase component 5 of pyruvate dehydrogenase complex [Olea europaea subsp. europaea]